MVPLDDVLSIDRNRHVFERLRELIGSGNGIVFSSAGASATRSPLPAIETARTRRGGRRRG